MRRPTMKKRSENCMQKENQKTISQVFVTNCQFPLRVIHTQSTTADVSFVFKKNPGSKSIFFFVIRITTGISIWLLQGSESDMKTDT